MSEMNGETRSLRNARRYVQHWECDCGESFSGPVERADEWMAEHGNGCSALVLRGWMTSLWIAEGDCQMPIPRGMWNRATDDSIPPGVIRIDGNPYPLIEFGDCQ